MREAWAETPVGDLATWLSGGTPLKSETTYWDGDIPWISGASLTGTHLNDSIRRVTEAGVKNGSRFAPQGATLILVRGMSLHQEVRIGHAMRQLAFNQDVKALIPNSDVDPWFLTWALLARHDELLHMVHAAGHGTGVLATDRLKALTIPLPPLAEQRRIAGVLGALDDLIETNRRLAHSCAKLRRAMLNHALISAERFQPLSELASFVNGKNFTKDATGTGRPVIRTPELRRGPNDGTVWSDAKPELDYVAQLGDILFVWSGSLMVERWLHEDGLVNQHIFKVVPKRGVPEWLVFALIEHQMPWFQSLAADKATTMGHIQRGHLDESVPMPSQQEIERLERIIAPLWNQELQSLIESQRLETTRDELIPLLISGAVTVTEAAA